MPDKKFMHSMGVASIVAGVVLLGLAQLAPLFDRLRPS